MATTQFKKQSLPKIINADVPLWFAVVTKFKCEKSVNKSLTQKRITCYTPIQKVTRISKTNGRTRKLELPLITCYVFVKITSLEHVKVLETENVIRFVQFGKQLSSIPEEEINILRQVTGEGVTGLEVSTTIFTKGDQVEVVSGELTGLKGRLVEIAGKRNFIIELNSLGLTLHPLHINPKHLRKVP